MIKSVKIKNYKSYKDEVLFSFEGLPQDALPENYSDIVLNDGSNTRLLHSAIILGANASGKTNVLWALYAINYLVESSRLFDFNLKKRSPLPYNPFAFDDSVNNAPTEFTIELVVEGNLYRYYIKYDSYRILSERLALMYKGEEILYFDVILSKGNKKSINVGKPLEDRRSTIASMDLLPNQLLLSVLGNKPTGDIQKIYNELASMDVEPMADAANLRNRNMDAAREIESESKGILARRLKRLVKIADVGIEDLSVEKREASSIGFQTPYSSPFEKESTTYHPLSVHKGYDSKGNSKVFVVQMDHYESLGTRHLYSLGARVLKVLNTGGILVYDEMNMAIHPALLALLVRMFNHEKSNPHHAQLVFTTHDISVVGDNQMRVDQVWFAEKNVDGESELFSAQDFDGVSIIAPVEQWYRSGLFGARPSLGSIDYIFEEDNE